MSNFLDEDEKADQLSLRTFHLFRDKLWPYVRRYRALFSCSLLLVFISTGLAIFIPWLLGYTVDHVLMPKRTDLILTMAMLFLCVTTLRSILMFSQTYLLTLLGQKVLHDLRQDLLRQYQYYPIAEFNRTSSGRMVTRLVNDTSALQDLFTGGIAVAFADVLIITGIILWMLALNPLLGIVCVSVFPLMAWAAAFFGKRIQDRYRTSRAALSRLNAFLAENVSGMWLIQVFNRQKYFKRKYDQVSTFYTSKQLATIQEFAYFQPTITVISSLSMSLLILFGGWLAVRQTSVALPSGITLGLLVSFMSYIQALFSPIREITEKYNLFVAAMASCEKIFEFMGRDVETGIDYAVEVEKKSFYAPTIEFKDVSFQYQSSARVLNNVNLEIKPGEKVGIVGHTGAGKTTVTSLILRFYDATMGEVLWNGKNIASFDKRWIRSQIGYIQQDPFLFSGTIADNLFLWNDECKVAFDHLPETVRAPFLSGRLKLEEEVYEKGANLSVGERQIIAFVRAIVQNPSVLILDEASAHIDMFTEQWIDQVSQLYFKDKTVITIAHRLSTLRQSDRILVFHHGSLVEAGAHAQLLREKGVYYKLYEIQSRKSELLGL